MYIKGVVKRDKKTKNLINRLEQKDIAIISHKDLDEIAARSLVEKKVSCVINTEYTISGRYPNLGPSILMENNIPIFEVRDVQRLDSLMDGDVIEIIDTNIMANGKKIADCIYIDNSMIEELLKLGYDNIENQLDIFIENTLEYARKEKGLVTGKITIPTIDTEISGKHVLVVVRGSDYKRDLITIKSYIDEVKPILIGVDGGGDALLEFGYVPDIVIGDMDSVSDNCLSISKEVIVHAYSDGRAPGLEKVNNLGIKAKIFPSPGTSEDVALLLAFEKDADLIVAVGSHSNMIDFLEKGRAGMSSTFLVRLKVGSKLVDAKGVNKLYSSSFKPKHLGIILAAAFIPMIILIIINPLTKNLLTLLKIKIRLLFRF
ncbi:putative cytokinetic ring protein SteA [Tissierella sp.]|uniref:putative cytokinetic ring protein SteA n=1 Tax=Tissierella sp. TaxID=41274 RepID=UPI0028655C11|nr:putative cytokinetic ring protein SteA [Tissierella sp.]MDR7856156.1 putative cytokinetic ring protein SteA [Tissierella sp.]